jgi:HAD superfamily hydrolase (TIGR01484 family)
MVVIDIDGTLVDGHGKLADEDKNAIGRLLDSGVTVSLCTGRILQTTMGIIDALGLKTFSIFYDGALIFNPRDSSTIYSGLLEPSTVRESRRIQLA